MTLPRYIGLSILLLVVIQCNLGPQQFMSEPMIVSHLEKKGTLDLQYSAPETLVLNYAVAGSNKRIFLTTNPKPLVKSHPKRLSGTLVG